MKESFGNSGIKSFWGLEYVLWSAHPFLLQTPLQWTECLCLPQIPMLNMGETITKITVWGSRVFWRRLGHEGKALMNWISALIKETTERSLSHEKTQGKGTVYKPGNRFSLDIESAGALIFVIMVSSLPGKYRCLNLEILRFQNCEKEKFCWLCKRSQTLPSGAIPLLTWTPCVQGGKFCIMGEVLTFCEAMALFYILSRFIIIFTCKAGKCTRFDPHWAGSCQDLLNEESF